MQDVHVGIVSGRPGSRRSTARRRTGLLPRPCRSCAARPQFASYRISGCSLSSKPARGQAPPTVEATLTGTASGKPFTRTLAMALNGTHFVVCEASQAVDCARACSVSEGTPAFASSVHSTNVAPKVGLNFTQDAFHYSLTDDPQAMMGGGVCWIDYNNDGWLDLYAVNSYNDGDLPNWEAHGGLPQSQLFREHARSLRRTSRRRRTRGLRVKGTGCAAADLNGDGYTDLIVTTATGVDLLWNNGNGTFTQGASSAGINPAYAWYSSISVADVNGDGRPDIFIAGYTNMLDRIQTSIAGFPTNYQGVRDLLYLNEGDKHFKEVGDQGGARGVALQPRARLGVHRRERRRAPRPLRRERRGPESAVHQQGGRAARVPLRRRGQDATASPTRTPGMGVAEGDYNDDGRPDLFITNSRGQPHAAYESGTTAGETTYTSEMAKFAKALDRRQTVGWGDSWVDLNNDTKPDLVVTNGSIPVLNLKKDTQQMQVLQDLGKAQFTNASGVISQLGLPKIIGRGLAAADFNNDGRMDIAVNSIHGPLVLLENTGKGGNWLEVSLKGFHPGAVLTAELPDGSKLVDELHAGQQLPLVGGSAGAFRARRRHEGRQADDPLPERHREGAARTSRANRILTIG